jgi:hypothetical protein
MIQQIPLGTRDGVRLGEEATKRGMAGVFQDLNDELTVICAYASLGGDVSYDAEQTENYFAMIESAGKKAAQITGQFLVVDAVRPSEGRHTKTVAWPAAREAVGATNDSGQAASSFRDRLTAARELVTG